MIILPLTDLGTICKTVFAAELSFSARSHIHSMVHNLPFIEHPFFEFYGFTQQNPLGLLRSTPNDCRDSGRTSNPCFCSWPQRIGSPTSNSVPVVKRSDVQ